MAIALPAAGLLAAHQSNLGAARAASTTSTAALATFTNQVTTIAPTWLVASPSTDQSGATDTAFLNSALTSLGSGGSLWLAPGAWYVNGPITPLAGQRISGLHGANQSGDGAGSGYGTVIHPVGTSWPSLNGCQAVFAYPNPLDQGELTDLWIDCSKFGGPNLSGVSAIGSVNAISLSRVGVYKAPADGVLLQLDPATNKVPDGWCLDTCLAQSCSGAGFYGRFNDASLINCHAQGCTGDGFFINSGNAKLTGCRGDLCANGFTIDVADGGGFNDATVLSGCGTQRNNQSGLNVVDGDGTTAGNGFRTPVVVDGCTFGGDGYNNGNPLDPSVFYAGIRVRGANTVFVGSVSVTVHNRGTTANPINCPKFGLTVGEMGTGSVYPLVVSIASGLLNGASAAVHDGSNGATRVSFGAGVVGAVGYQPTTFTTPTP